MWTLVHGEHSFHDWKTQMRYLLPKHLPSWARDVPHHRGREKYHGEREFWTWKDDIIFAFFANLWQNCLMQYKIPIQIENEDTIIFDLSLRQLGIIMVGLIISFWLFNKLQGTLGNTPLFIICAIVMLIFIVVAKFKTHEMTFLPFVLNLLRFRINGNGYNGRGRVWMRGVDSYSPLEMWYVQSDSYVESNKKHVKNTKNLAEQVKKI